MALESLKVKGKGYTWYSASS